MTRMADRFNLRRLEATLVSLLMVSFALIFPYVLRREKVLLWSVGVCGLLLISTGVMVFRNRQKADKEKNGALDESQDEVSNGDQDHDKIVILEGSKENIEIENAEEPREIEASESTNFEVPGESEVCKESEPLGDQKQLQSEDLLASMIGPIHTKEFSLEELIEKGFQAKDQGRFHLAAEWFMLALDQKPSYDIAFYLIVETCEHWKNGSSIYDALDKVAPYLNEYIQSAPPEWGTQLMEWMEKENLPIPSQILGRIDQ